MGTERREKIPQGYAWKNLPGTQARFLMPETWFFHTQQAGNTRAFFLTRESIVDQGMFTTGLFVNIFRNIRRKVGRSSIEMARGIMNTLPVIPVSGITVIEDGPLVICRRFFVQPVSQRMSIPQFRGGFVEKIVEPTTFYVETVGNRETDTAQVIQFETPTRLWKDYRQTARIMIDQGMLDKTV